MTENSGLLLPELAERLRRLHHEDTPLVLPNAWDVPSACVFARHPLCRALGTTSAGIAATLGYPDGEVLPPEEMFAAIRRITRVVNLPVTADVEAGYGANPDEVATTIRKVLDAGAVGVNLEDASDTGLLDTAEAVERIRAARDAADVTEVPMVINARTDVYWRHVGEPDGRFDHAMERLKAYRRAGADCLFAPGVTDIGAIRALVESVEGPLNVLAGPGAPTVPELRGIGVARISVGSGPARAAITHLQHLANELFRDGTYTAIENALPYTELADLLRTQPRSSSSRSH